MGLVINDTYLPSQLSGVVTIQKEHIYIYSRLRLIGTPVNRDKRPETNVSQLSGVDCTY